MKKNVLITGASSGFGKLAAQMLLDQKQWTVYACARREEKMQDLADKGAHVLKVDVTQEEDLQRAADLMISNDGRIDALLANAGFGSYGMIESVTMDEIKYQYDVNVFGVARSLKAVLPQMRKQKSGRIVITESIVSHISTLGLGWYASTKHALRGMSVALRQEVRDFGIDVVAIEPGAVNTEFDEVAFETLKNTPHQDDYKQLADDFLAYMKDSYKKAPGPKSTARAMVRALNASKPKTVYQTTPDAKVAPTMMSIMPDRTYDNMILSSVKKAGQKKG